MIDLRYLDDKQARFLDPRPYPSHRHAAPLKIIQNSGVLQFMIRFMSDHGEKAEATSCQSKLIQPVNRSERRLIPHHTPHFLLSEQHKKPLADHHIPQHHLAMHHILRNDHLMNNLLEDDIRKHYLETFNDHHHHHRHIIYEVLHYQDDS